MGGPEAHSISCLFLEQWLPVTLELGKNPSIWCTGAFPNSGTSVYLSLSSSSLIYPFYVLPCVPATWSPFSNLLSHVTPGLCRCWFPCVFAWLIYSSAWKLSVTSEGERPLCLVMLSMPINVPYFPASVDP